MFIDSHCVIGTHAAEASVDAGDDGEATPAFVDLDYYMTVPGMRH
jgi:hypothetical protein